MDDKKFMERAIEKAQESTSMGGFPAGAVLVRDNVIIGEGVSIGNILHDPTSHGELLAIREACKNLSTTILSGCTLYASMEPCIMCLSASMWSSVSRIVFALRKERVSPEYYGGKYETSNINSLFSRPIEIVHLHHFEQDSLSLVREWGQLQK